MHLHFASAAKTLAFALLLLGCSSDGAGASSDSGSLDGGSTDTRPLDDTSPPPHEVASVVTHHNDNLRTGANLHETELSTATVSSDTFGLLFSRSVVGFVYAQPLFVPNLAIAGGRHDVVFVATEHDEVYAFDASDSTATEPLWHVSLGTPIASTDFDADQGSPYRDIIPELGVTSTPVIDLASETIYVVAQSKEGSEIFNRLHALSIIDGSERPNSPQLVVVSAKGTAKDAVGGTITIPQRYLLQRPGLNIDRGVLWIAGGGHGDFGPYHGWILTYELPTLKLLGTFLTTPDGEWGGLWQAGNSLAIDEDGAAYFMSGNGTFDETTSPPNLGDSFGKVKLDAGGLSLVDWFTPFNEADLSASDTDLGSSGPSLLPGTNFLFGGGKEGKIYLLDRSSLGHKRPLDDTQVVQVFQATHGSPTLHIHGGPVYWDGPSGKRIYVVGENDIARAFRFVGDRFETTAFTVSTAAVPHGTPGGVLALSSDGKKPGTGIVWLLAQSDDNKDGYITGNAALHAFDAEDLSHELYSSLTVATDDIGAYAKFAVPTIVGGKVFVGTAAGALRVFGSKR